MPLTSAPQQPGQLAAARDRRWVVVDVAESELEPDPLLETEPRRQHLVTLAAVDEDAVGEEVRLVWELEPGASVIERAALPSSIPRRSSRAWRGKRPHSASARRLDRLRHGRVLAFGTFAGAAMLRPRSVGRFSAVQAADSITPLSGGIAGVTPGRRPFAGRETIGAKMATGSRLIETAALASGLRLPYGGAAGGLLGASLGHFGGALRVLLAALR